MYKFSLYYCGPQTGASANRNSDSGLAIPVIAGSVGGAAFISFIVLLCVVVLFIRYSHKKKSHMLDITMATELSSDVKMDRNPSYSITKQTTKQDYQYDYVLHNKTCQGDSEDTTKMESNPSYWRIQGINTVVRMYIMDTIYNNF